MMKTRFVLAASLMIACVSNAVDAHRPVLVVVQKNIGAKAQVSSLLLMGISAWANHFVNKSSAEKVDRFDRALGDTNAQAQFDAEAARVFGCFGAEPGCADQTAFTEAAPFEAALAQGPDRTGVVIEIAPELILEQFMLRAVAHKVALGDKGKTAGKQVEQGGYIAVFTTRAPAPMADLRKSQPAALEEFWQQGETKRIHTDAYRGLREINTLFALLEADGTGTAKLPEKWQDLPKVKQFAKAGNQGRMSCSGPAWCATTYVLRDNGDSFVLVSSGSTAGWFDAAAAAKETNLPFFAMLGIPYK